MYLNIKINIIVVMDCYCFDQIFLRLLHKEAYMDFLHCIFCKNLYFPY